MQRSFNRCSISHYRYLKHPHSTMVLIVEHSTRRFYLNRLKDTPYLIFVHFVTCNEILDPLTFTRFPNAFRYLGCPEEPVIASKIEDTGANHSIIVEPLHANGTKFKNTTNKFKSFEILSAKNIQLQVLLKREDH
jgi:hypothetical protein